MIREEVEQLSTTPRDLRKFGLMVGGVFLLLGGWTVYRHKPIGPYLLTPGVLLVFVGWAAPTWLKGVYRGWMTMAYFLGLVVSTCVLTVFFFFAVTPLGVVARLFGKDFLSMKWNPSAKSYWQRREQANGRSPADYEQQF